MSPRKCKCGRRIEYKPGANRTIAAAFAVVRSWNGQLQVQYATGVPSEGEPMCRDCAVELKQSRGG